jgi:hypothetical protein
MCKARKHPAIGPWDYEAGFMDAGHLGEEHTTVPDGSFIIFSNQESEIATTSCEADAKLIAAAPDMFDICAKLALRFASANGTRNIYSDDQRRYFRELREIVERVEPGFFVRH